ncbi:MAG: C25 family cysteine peptidase [Bacteroidetes bacterium]|nr:C25 family cysteine peptidase [Bacteroidota bacterium]
MKKSYAKRLLPYLFLLAVLVFASFISHGQGLTNYQGNWGPAGFNIEQQDTDGMQLTFSVPQFSLNDAVINGKKVKTVELPGVFLPNNAGAPNLPGTGRYIAIPQGSNPVLEVVGMRTELLTNIDIGPAPRIPKETEVGLEYPVDENIYQNNAYYPSQPVLLGDQTKVRGVDVVMLGFTPFQYNPVTKEMLVIKDIRVKIHFQGGNGHYGDNRLRSRWFDPLLQDMLLNPEVLPKVNYNRSMVNTDDIGCEYLIIVPNETIFTQWADSIKEFRTRQGINTDIKTLAEIGGNDAVTIENYINNAYNTWTIPPVAILLLGDYGTDPNNSIAAPIWNSYCVSDNIYGDIDGTNSMPEVVMARITAQDEAQLEVMVHKFLNYERNPPISENFYNHPVSALGWQTERWFQLCSEVIKGFWQNSLGKSPVRINEVYGGDPSVDPWSTATNTSTVVDYFGPSGLGYIPSTPQSLGNWTGGNATMINSAINDGCFMLQHRDHGFEEGWGEPAYSNSDIDGLTNTDLTFIMSVNCLTGKYNNATECFAEKFHRYTYNGVPAGALGLLAASEVSYSFVNDAFIWGVYDNLWPNFMPGYGSNPPERGILPAFGNAAGKYFLEQSGWPYKSPDKEVTYNLFHHHGDAFLSVYSEVPQYLTVVHAPTIYTGVTSLDVTADTGSFICLSYNGVILATATGTGSPLPIIITGTLLPPDHIDVVVTMQNYYRYEGEVLVIPPTGPFVVKNNYVLNDNPGNSNGQLDYGETVLLTVTMKNVGNAQANNVAVTLSSADPYVIITTSGANYGNIPANGLVTVTDAFGFSVTNDIPNNHIINFTLTANDDASNTWVSYFTIKGHAPVLHYQTYMISDPAGNNNNRVDPGETVDVVVSVKNTGSSDVFNVLGVLSSTDPYVTINSTSQGFGTITGGNTIQAAFSITADISTPVGHGAVFDLQMNGDLGISGSGGFTTVIGQIPILIVDHDPNTNSGPAMNTAIQALGLQAVYSTTFPADLSVYSSIFVCLGIYSSNYVLSSAEGQQLATYLDGGGRLYMEGGDTWAYDSQTPVHSYFKVTPGGDGNGDLGTLTGQSGTFTEGMNFLYSGDNAYIDHISAANGSGAFAIFQNQNPSYGTGVAYDGGSYRTIACSHEFGGLSDGVSPSTCADLMMQYLTFFGLYSEVLTANFTATSTSVCTGNSVTFHDLSYGNPVSWSWSYPGGTPATSALENPTVFYNTAGHYDVILIVSDGNGSDTITKLHYIYADPCTGVGSNPQNSFSADLYPNPVHSGLTLQLRGVDNSDVKIKITNPLGEVITEKTILMPGNEATLTMDTHSWAKGFYFLTIETKQSRVFRKILAD